MGEEQTGRLTRRVLAGRGPLWWRRRVAGRLAATPAGADALARVIAGGGSGSGVSYLGGQPYAAARVAPVARDALATAAGQDVIDAVCQVWYYAWYQRGAHDPVLGELIAQAGWVASGPAAVRIATALLNERHDLLADPGPDLVRALVTAADGEPSQVRGGARAALLALRGADAREIVCEQAVEGGSPAALDAALAGSFAPAAAARRAVLLFLAGDFGRYAELDFDGTLLRAAYRAVHPSVRARLAHQARAAGRVEWVRNLTAGPPSGESAELSDDEWEATARVLAGARRWAELWRLALTAPPVWSVRMLRELDRHGWVPGSASQRAGFAELASLANRCAGDHPPALAYDRWTVPGGDLKTDRRFAMTPDGGLLACADPWGVSIRRLPSGEQLGHFQAADVRSLAITPDGRCLAAVFRERLAILPLPSLDPASSTLLTVGAVTRLAMTPDGRLLAGAGGDPVRIRLWRLPSGSPAGVVYAGYAQVSCLAVSPDGAMMLSGHSDGRLRLWRLPSGEPAGTLDLSAHHRAVAAIALSRDGSRLFTADPHGGLRRWFFPSGEPFGEMSRVSPQPSLVVLPDGKLMVADGLGRARLWQPSARDVAGELGPDSANAVDATASADGAVIAARVGEQVLLWRSPLVTVCRTPAGQIDPAEVGRLRSGGARPPGERGWLDLAEALVRWRHRYDIETADAAAPGSGTDIEVD